MELLDVSIRKGLGQGYFGKVLLGDLQVNDKTFQKAIKVQSHSKKYTDKNRIRVEYDIMNTAFKENEFFIMHAMDFKSLDDRNWIMMDYIDNMNLYELLKTKVLMTKSETQFYLAETGLGLDWLHKKGYVYRDLKPDNIMVTPQGHLKLTDFGLCQRLWPGQVGFSICGTFEYIAPEMYLGNGYSFEIDIWSLGIMAWELMTGRVPISIVDKKQADKVVLTQLIKFPGFMDLSTRELFKGLLSRNPKNRLKWDEIQKLSFWDDHEISKDIFWEKAKNLELKPPFTS